jgi:hypothetical protein
MSISSREVIMSQMILEYDEFCMVLLNIEVFNIMTPDFPYTSENGLERHPDIYHFCQFHEKCPHFSLFLIRH